MNAGPQPRSDRCPELGTRASRRAGAGRRRPSHRTFRAEDPIAQSPSHAGRRFLPHPWFTGQSWSPCGPEVQEVPTPTTTLGSTRSWPRPFIAASSRCALPLPTSPSGRSSPAAAFPTSFAPCAGCRGYAPPHHHHRTPVDVISLSLGCYTHDDKPSPVLEHGLHAFGHETVVVACAGELQQ